MSNKTEYQIGQAVIFLGNGELQFGFIVDVNFIDYSVVNLADSHYAIISGSSRPATEAEILAEIAKHEWELTDIEYITGKHINLIKTVRKGWVYGGGNSISTENLKELCEEGIVAHRIITALNLAK